MPIKNVFSIEMCELFPLQILVKEQEIRIGSEIKFNEMEFYVNRKLLPLNAIYDSFEKRYDVEMTTEEILKNS